jgi:hypothetical protein
MASNDWMTERLKQMDAQLFAQSEAQRPLDMGEYRVGGRVFDMYNDADVDALSEYMQGLPVDSEGNLTVSPEDYDSISAAMTFVDDSPESWPDVPSANKSYVVGDQSRLRNFAGELADEMASATHAGMRALTHDSNNWRDLPKTWHTVKNSAAKNLGLLGDFAQGALGYSLSKLPVQSVQDAVAPVRYNGMKGVGGKWVPDDGKVGFWENALAFDSGLGDKLGAMFPAPKKADANLQKFTDFYADVLAVIPQMKAAGGLTRAAVKDAAQVGRVALNSPRQAAEMLGDRWIEGNKVFDATQGHLEQTLGLPEGVMPRGNTGGRSDIFYPIFDSQSNQTQPWMKDLVEETRKLRASGVSPEDAYKRTRTVLGGDSPDGVTRVELDDSKMVVDEKLLKTLGLRKAVPLSKAAHHPEFSAADYRHNGMPTNQEMRFVNDMGYDDGVIGELANDAKRNYLYATGKLGKNVRKRTIVHELQHKVDNDKMIADSGANDYLAKMQAIDAKRKAEHINALSDADYEGMTDRLRALKLEPRPTKAMLDEMADLQIRRSEALDSANKARGAVGMEKDSALLHNLYLTNIGEANARLAEGRANLTMKQRKNQYPYDEEYYKSMTGYYPDELWGSRASKNKGGSVLDVSPEGEALSPYGMTMRFPDTFNSAGFEPRKNTPRYAMDSADHKQKHGLDFIVEMMKKEEDWNKVSRRVLEKNPKAYVYTGLMPEYSDRVDLAKLRKEYPRILAENQGLGARISRAKHEAQIKFDPQARSFSTLRKSKE